MKNQDKKPGPSGGPEDQAFSIWWQPALIIFARLSAWIVAPVLFALWAGKKLDDRYDTAPWFFLLTLGAAFFISMAGITVNALKEISRIEDEAKKRKEKDPKGDN